MLKEIYNIPRWDSEDNVDYLFRIIHKLNYFKYEWNELLEHLEKDFAALSMYGEEQKIIMDKLKRIYKKG